MKQMFYILAARISKSTGIEEVACRGLLRLSAEIKSGYTDTPALANYVDALNYRDWEAIILQPDLRQRLSGLGIKNIDEVINQLHQTLIDNQSLFALSAR
jgi:hypothetical protein